MTLAEALNRIEKMERTKPKRKDVKERLKTCRKSVEVWKHVPAREIELLEGILFTASVDGGEPEETEEE